MKSLILVPFLLFFLSIVSFSQDIPRVEKKGMILFDWHSTMKMPELDKILEKVKPFEEAEVKSNPEKVARKFLQAISPAVTGKRTEGAIEDDINKSLELKRSFVDQLQDTTVVFGQTYQGIPVYGNDVRVALKKEGTLRAITSKFSPDLKLSTIASISPKQAIQTAIDDSKQPKELQEISKDKQTLPKLFAYRHKDNKYHLIWLVEIQGVEEKFPALWRYFIDAHDGSILDRYNNLKFQSSVEGRGKGVYSERQPLYVTKLAEDAYVLQDISNTVKISTYDFEYKDVQLNYFDLPGTMLRNPTLEWNDAIFGAAVDAHYFARIVFDYYWTIHQRNSLDDNGMELISSVHGTWWRQPGPGGDFKKWNNAVWVGTQMIYGDGDGVQFAPLSAALDVVAHEFTHGVTDHTANLEYKNQSGALNESYSDVFAAMIDSANWEIGETVTTPNTPGDALRSLENPPLYDQPDDMDGYIDMTEDNGGVHTNSGIPNKAAYLLAMGGTHNNITVQPLGREVTAQIYYLALTKYLSQLSDFDDARTQTIKACLDLFPGQLDKEVAVKRAFAAVRIGKAP